MLIRTDLHLILASQSPRRKQLLTELGFDFSVQTKNTDEAIPLHIGATEAAAYLAEKKARAFENELLDNQAVLTADTVVVCNGEVLNKPADEAEAVAMLQLLSGNAHQVITGVSLLTRQGITTRSDTAKVYFRVLSLQEITHYVQHYRPFDKAGAYGIQEWIGMIGITKIEGSFFTVMGLPTHLVYDMIQQLPAATR
ncbi:Maf family nucleotide pyrophosphatase [Rhodoflexus sp.]